MLQSRTPSSVTVRYETAEGKPVEQVFAQPFTIGRSAVCDVRFETRTVSSVHARVSHAQGTWWVQDLDSRNGTYAGGQPVQRQEIRGAITIRLGSDGPVLTLTEGDQPATASSAPRYEEPPTLAAAPPLRRKASAPGAWTETGVYRGNRFVLTVPEGWEEQTVHVLKGPFSDNLQHNVTIMVDPKVPFDRLADYVDVQVRALEQALHGCRMLKRGDLALANGLPAQRVIYSWTPTDGRLLFQEQVFVLQAGTGYQLTASFTRKTRKLLGPRIEQVMLGFEPDR